MIPPRCGAAMAVFLGANHILGGVLGPVITFARSVDGTPARAVAEGLHGALLAVVPAALLLAAIGLFAASRTVRRDAERMRAQLTLS